MIIRTWFGLEQDPFSTEIVTLLDHQDEVYETLKVHTQQGGFCLVMGVPGTGKTVIKETIKQKADKRTNVVMVARTMHTYSNTVRILCQAFNIEHNGANFKCEKRLIEEAHTLNRTGKTLITIIDDAHLMDMETLRKLRLLFEDFPKNHNVILVGQPGLLFNMSLKVNDDIKSRVTYSVTMPKLAPDTVKKFILDQLDMVNLPHNTFSDDALGLIIRSADGILRRVRNLCLSCMLDAARSRKKIIDTKIVNQILLQPHWRNDIDITPA